MACCQATNTCKTAAHSNNASYKKSGIVFNAAVFFTAFAHSNAIAPITEFRAIGQWVSSEIIIYIYVWSVKPIYL